MLLYHLTKEDAASVCAKLEAEKIRCCVSDVFSNLYLCKSKRMILKRIAMLENSEEFPVRTEMEWSMKGLYTYTSSMLETSGLRDYSVDRLFMEDEKNHTELYHTLKTYLLCENNVTAAAKVLHIHRNTLVYRMKQIKECIGTDFNDYEVARELLAYIMMNDVWREKVRSRG